ncbi:MAG: AAA family ATPase [Euryarchaeota archaeon]|nr:AAA family ATPase [Euryarchaeota archaeon]
MLQDTKCISFVNPKGGTGKTTSCVSIGGSLAKEGKKVLIVDFDPRANATLALGIDSSTLKKSIYDVVLSYCGYNHTPITSVILETKVPNLHIAPSEPDLAVAEVLMQNTKNKSFILKQMISDIYNNDYIKIKAPPPLTESIYISMIIY